MIYRKRGGSLEQSLVMPSPRSSNNSAEYHQNKRMSASTDMPATFPTDDGCYSQVPFASLTAFLLCFFGVILFTTMMMWAFNATVEQVRRATLITDFPWLDKVQLLFIISALAMLTIVIAFLLIGILSTGQTRQNVFQRKQARRGGQISCIVAICLASVLNLIWILILTMTAIMCFIYTIFTNLCSKAVPANGHSCLNLSAFAPFIPSNNQATLELCDGELQQFCALSNAIVLWYYVGLVGALLICMGLVQFIATNAANCSHIGNESRYRELREVFYSETVGYPLGKIDHYRKLADGDNNRPPALPHVYGERQDIDIDRSAHTGGFVKQSYTKQSAQKPVKVLPSKPYHQQFQPHQPQMRSPSRNANNNKSIGVAILATHRRHSYQNSLNGSNNWLNEQADARIVY